MLCPSTAHLRFIEHRTSASMARTTCNFLPAKPGFGCPIPNSSTVNATTKPLLQPNCLYSSNHSYHILPNTFPYYTTPPSPRTRDRPSFSTHSPHPASQDHPPTSHPKFRSSTDPCPRREIFLSHHGDRTPHTSNQRPALRVISSSPYFFRSRFIQPVALYMVCTSHIHVVIIYHVRNIMSHYFPFSSQNVLEIPGALKKCPLRGCKICCSPRAPVQQKKTEGGTRSSGRKSARESVKEEYKGEDESAKEFVGG